MIFEDVENNEIKNTNTHQGRYITSICLRFHREKTLLFLE